MKKSIGVLGSTGSIGVQTLDVAKNLDIKVIALSTNSNIDLLVTQAYEFHPKKVVVTNELYYKELKNRLSNLDIEVLTGNEGLLSITGDDDIDTVVVAVVGIAGLIPTINAIEHGKNIALANKEALVTGGEIIMNKAYEKGVNIIPIDSEHSAIFQCLMGNNIKQLKKLSITASGGPFRGKSIEDLKGVTLYESLRHPNWRMGKKITIDSATMMNKGLEVIEARWLFNVSSSKIEVIVHPESIVHSMVTYIDNSVMAQLGIPDMRIPIQLALTYPDRVETNVEMLDLTKYERLTFEKPDVETFVCLRLAYEALKLGGLIPTVLNAANEVAVEYFLNDKIKFLDIPKIIEDMMQKFDDINISSIENIMNIDKNVRKTVIENINTGYYNKAIITLGGGIS